MKKIFFVAIIFLILARFASAAPSVSGVSGSMNHGQNITISGSGFGVKSPAAPVFWGDLENISADNPDAVVSEAGFSSVATSAICSGNPYGDARPQVKNSLSPRWIGSPHFRSQKIIGGGIFDTVYPAGSGEQECENSYVEIKKDGGSKFWYALYYQRLSSDFPKQYQGYAHTIGHDEIEINLGENINASQNTLTVHGADYALLRQYDVILIDSEKMDVLSRNGNLITVSRGHLGTAPSTHSVGAIIYMRGESGPNYKTGFPLTVPDANGNRVGFQGSGLRLGNESSSYNSWTWDQFGESYGQAACRGCSQLQGFCNAGSNAGNRCLSNADCPGGSCADSIYGIKNSFSSPDATAEWKHVETVLHDAAPGWAKTLVDNQIARDCSCANPEEEFQGWCNGAPCPRLSEVGRDIEEWRLGIYSPRYFYPEGRPNGMYSRISDKSWHYLDDIYVDTTLARVVLANNSNYNNATIIEPQIPSAWADGSLTVKVNGGKIPDGQPAYLFVFDANNERNATGYPVTLAGSGDTTPPSAPQGLSVQ